MKRNKMCNKILVIMLSLFLIACQTTSTWEKRGATPQQEQLDLKSCEFEAKKHDESALRDTHSSKMRFYELRDLCLESKGYVKTSTDQKLF